MAARSSLARKLQTATDTLTEEQLAEVLDFAEHLRKRAISAASRGPGDTKWIAALAGSISPDMASELEAVVQQEFERIEEDAW